MSRAGNVGFLAGNLRYDVIRNAALRAKISCSRRAIMSESLPRCRRRQKRGNDFI
jgi:hypothetical protein